MNSIATTYRGRGRYIGIVGFFALSFWSSGIFLIRVLGTYGLWSSQIFMIILFTVSIPLVYISILSVTKLFSSSKSRGDSVVYDTLTSVLLLHALVLAIRPALYSLSASPALSAAAWLLWFAGVTLVLSRRRNNS